MSLFNATDPSDSTISRTSTVNDSEVEFSSESVAVTTTSTTPLICSSAVSVRLEPSSTMSTGEGFPVYSVIVKSKVISPSKSWADTAMLCVCPLLRIKSSSGSIVGA